MRRGNARCAGLFDCRALRLDRMQPFWAMTPFGQTKTCSSAASAGSLRGAYASRPAFAVRHLAPPQLKRSRHGSRSVTIAYADPLRTVSRLKNHGPHAT